MVHQGECRRVTFNKKKPQCFEILNVDDYTESEIEDSWWSEDEQRIQKEQRDKIVESIDKGLRSRRGGSFRGLEKLVVEGYVEMTHRRHRCIDAVMDEQERQWNNLTSNLERRHACAATCVAPNPHLDPNDTIPVLLNGLQALISIE